MNLINIPLKKNFRVACLILLLINTGCGSLGNLIAGGEGNVDTFGAKPLIDTDTFEKLDLARQLNPDSEGMSEDMELKVRQKNLRQAFEDFYDNPINQKKRRNRLQERILAASNQRCVQYIRYIKALDSRTNFVLGTITTALAGAGAIFTAVDTVRALAGSAAIVSGTRAEFNEDYFSNLTIQVLSEGIDSRRRETYEEIQGHQKNNLTKYPVEAAIKDAITYHNQCSLVAGLQHAALSIKRAEDPGMDRAQKTLIKAKQLQHIMDTEPSRISTLQMSGAFGPGVMSSSRSSLSMDNLFAEDGPGDTYTQALSGIKNLKKDFNITIDKHKKTDFKSNADALAGLPVELNNAAKQAHAAILTHKKEVLLKENNLRDLEIEILTNENEIIDDTTSPDRPRVNLAKRLELTKAQMDGAKVSADIQTILLTFQLGLLEVEDSLADKKEGDPTKRAGTADKKMHAITAQMEKFKETSKKTPTQE